MEYQEVPNENRDETDIDIRDDGGDEPPSHTYLTTAKQSDKQCPICLDTFRHPKLLPCMHTFCLICIRTYMIKTKNKNQIMCPMCRQTCRVITENLDCILNNYFVETTITIKSSKSCALCNKCDDDVIGCLHCDIDVCSECIVLHERMSSQKEQAVAEVDIIRRSRDVDDDNVSLPFHIVLFLPPIRTIVLTKEISSFSVGSQSQDSRYVNSVCPGGQGQCWIVSSSGPEVVLFDVEGREIRKVDSGCRLSDGISAPDNSLLVAVLDRRRNRHEVLKISPEGEIGLFVNYNNSKPAEISLFPDGRLVVAWLGDSDSGNEGTHGTVHIYSAEGKLLKDIGETADLSILPYPYAVAVNPIYGFIYVTDRAKRTVVILTENGDIIGTYESDSSTRDIFGLLVQRRFNPSGICCDLEGNVIVCDTANDILHLLSPKGEFIGIIKLKADNGNGSPGTAAVDDKGRIWIGYEDGIISVLEVNGYHNNFENEEE